MTDRELLELAAKAAGLRLHEKGNADRARYYPEVAALYAFDELGRINTGWNPLADDGDRYRLAKKLGISIDFNDCCAWKRLPDHSLIQEFWGGDCGDEAHAVVRAAAEIGKEMP